MFSLFSSTLVGVVLCLCNQSIYAAHLSCDEEPLDANFLQEEEEASSGTRKRERSFLALDIDSPAKRQKLEVKSSSHDVAVSQPIDLYKEIGSFVDVNVNELVAKEGTTIVLFDIDRTLLCPALVYFDLDDDSQEIYLRRFFGYRADVGYPIEKMVRNLFKDYLAKQHGFVPVFSARERLVEDNAPQFIKSLAEAGAVVMGLTARNRLIAPQTISALGQHNIDFSSSPAVLSESRDGHSKMTCGKLVPQGYENRIIYTANLYRKVKEIPLAVQIAKEDFNAKGPFTVVHFDDAKPEVVAINKADFSTSDDVITARAFLYRAHKNLIMVPMTQASIIDELEVLFAKFLEESIK